MNQSVHTNPFQQALTPRPASEPILQQADQQTTRRLAADNGTQTLRALFNRSSNTTTVLQQEPAHVPVVNAELGMLSQPARKRDAVPLAAHDWLSQGPTNVNTSPSETLDTHWLGKLKGQVLDLFFEPVVTSTDSSGSTRPIGLAQLTRYAFAPQPIAVEPLYRQYPAKRSIW